MEMSREGVAGGPGGPVPDRTWMEMSASISSMGYQVACTVSACSKYFAWCRALPSSNDDSVQIPSSNPQALHEERDRDHPIPGYCSARTPAEHQAMGAAKACRCQHPCRVKMTGFRCERRWRTSPWSLCCRFGLPRFHAACCTRQRLGLPARSRAPSRLQRKQLDTLHVFPQEGGVSTGS